MKVNIFVSQKVIFLKASIWNFRNRWFIRNGLTSIPEVHANNFYAQQSIKSKLKTNYFKHTALMWDDFFQYNWWLCFFWSCTVYLSDNLHYIEHKRKKTTYNTFKLSLSLEVPCMILLCLLTLGSVWLLLIGLTAVGSIVVGKWITSGTFNHWACKNRF